MPDTSRRPRYPLILAVVLVSVVAYALLQSLVVPVLPTLQRSLHTSEDTVTWLLTVYLLTASVATPILGRLGDMAGKKKVLVATLVILAAGAVLGAVATTISVMIVARAIQGVGGAVVPLSFGIIRDEAPRNKVSSGIGIAAALLAVGAGAGIVLAGPIVDALDYHWLFWIPAVVVAVAAVSAFLIVPESRSHAGGRLPVVPALLLSGWLVALIVALSEGQAWGWTSAKTLGLLVIAVVVGVTWFRVEVRAPEPLIDMRMMRLPAVWTTNLVALLFGAGLYAAIAFLPELVQTPPSAGYGFGASATASGLFLLPMTVTMFFCGILSSHMAARIGSKMVLFFGSAATVVPFAILAFAHGQPWPVYLASAILGVGLGFAFAAMSNIIVESVPPGQVGVASGMNANIRTIGGSIGAAMMATIVTSGGGAGGFPSNSGYTKGFSFLMLAAILATLACLLIPSSRRAERALLDDAHVVEHGETGTVPGAGLVDLK